MSREIPHIEISLDNRKPTYQQIADQLRAAILDGKLKPGTRLPSIPSLVESLGVARGTAQQAMRQLKLSGLVVARVGSGTFVRQHRGELIQLLVPPALRIPLDDWLRSQGLYLAGPIPVDSQDVPTYVIGVEEGYHIGHAQGR